MIVFALSTLAPGDPIDASWASMLRPRRARRCARNTASTIPSSNSISAGSALSLQGDWGTSIQQRVPVLPLVLEKFWITLTLTGAAASLRHRRRHRRRHRSAVKQNSWVDRTILMVSVFALSMPPYWLGLIGIFVFSVELHWLPTGGMHNFSGEQDHPRSPRSICSCRR